MLVELLLTDRPEVLDAHTIVLAHTIRAAHRAGFRRNVVTIRDVMSIRGRQVKKIISVDVHPIDIEWWLEDRLVKPAWYKFGRPDIVQASESRYRHDR